MIVYVGYDSREHAAYEVCKASMLRRSSVPLEIIALSQHELRAGGVYDRDSFITTKGQRIDAIDRKPFSTEFSFSRFLVPSLAVFQGWSMYCDCDFLFTADLAGLFGLIDNRYAVMCVKHQHDPIEATKMDGAEQTRYRRKNWSSLVLWNNAHPSNAHLSVQCVNRMPGQWLHGFDWLKDEEIGALPTTWNWLSGVSEGLPEKGVPCGIHYTLGFPEMAGCEDFPFADLWRQERDSRRLPGSGPLPSERVRALIPQERLSA